MLESLQHLIGGFAIATTIDNLIYCVMGAIVGTVVGVLPGLGPIAGIALLIPATYSLNATSAIIMLAGIYYGAMYGGATTSILINVPGETASVITCIEGHQIAQKGRAGPALAICAIGSFVAGSIGIFGLVFLAPPLAEAAILVDLQRKGMQVVIPDAASFREKAKPAVDALFEKQWSVTTWKEVLAQ